MPRRRAVPIPAGGFRSIAVLRLSALGDVILATPVVHALRRAFPSARLAFWVKEEYADVLRHEPALDHVRVVLIMSVVPGFSGQKFMPEVLKKCETIKPRLRPDQRLEIDGGINPSTITSAKNAGVDWFVVASAIFDKPDRRAAIAELRRLID